MPTQKMLGRFGKLFFLILQICMLHFGFGKSRVSTVLECQTKEKTLRIKKFYLKQEAVKLNSSNYLEAFKSCRNELTKIIKAATNVQFYNTKLQNSKNSKEGWNTLNNLLNLTGNPKPQLLMTWTVEKM